MLHLRGQQSLLLLHHCSRILDKPCHRIVCTSFQPCSLWSSCVLNITKMSIQTSIFCVRGILKGRLQRRGGEGWFKCGRRGRCKGPRGRPEASFLFHYSSMFCRCFLWVMPKYKLFVRAIFPVL